MQIKDLVEKIISFGERQLEGEVECRMWIESLLNENKVDYQLMKFQTNVPRYLNYSLKVDAKPIPCLPTSYVSGKIESNKCLTSVFCEINESETPFNINFNPLCDSISRHTHYFHPSLAISKHNLADVINAKKIEGVVEVDNVLHDTASILVGNIKNPKKILFSHFDSVEIGATDNASGTAVMLYLALNYPDFLKENLLVFDSNEELSFEKPIYWGKGYRVFEDRYGDLLDKAEEILIVDCVGQTPLEVITEPGWLFQGFPIKQIDKYASKIKMLAGDVDALMSVYQSPIDTLEQQDETYLKEALDYILKN